MMINKKATITAVLCAIISHSNAARAQTPVTDSSSSTSASARVLESEKSTQKALVDEAVAQTPAQRKSIIDTAAGNIDNKISKIQQDKAFSENDANNVSSTTKASISNALSHATSTQKSFLSESQIIDEGASTAISTEQSKTHQVIDEATTVNQMISEREKFIESRLSLIISSMTGSIDDILSLPEPPEYIPVAKSEVASSISSGLAQAISDMNKAKTDGSKSITDEISSMSAQLSATTDPNEQRRLSTLISRGEVVRKGFPAASDTTIAQASTAINTDKTAADTNLQNAVDLSTIYSVKTASSSSIEGTSAGAVSEIDEAAEIDMTDVPPPPSPPPSPPSPPPSPPSPPPSPPSPPSPPPPPLDGEKSTAKALVDAEVAKTQSQRQAIINTATDSIANKKSSIEQDKTFSEDGGNNVSSTVKESVSSALSHAISTQTAFGVGSTTITEATSTAISTEASTTHSAIDAATDSGGVTAPRIEFIDTTLPGIMSGMISQINEASLLEAPGYIPLAKSEVTSSISSAVSRAVSEISTAQTAGSQSITDNISTLNALLSNSTDQNEQSSLSTLISTAEVVQQAFPGASDAIIAEASTTLNAVEVEAGANLQAATDLPAIYAANTASSSSIEGTSAGAVSEIDEAAKIDMTDVSPPSPPPPPPTVTLPPPPPPPPPPIISNSNTVSTIWLKPPLDGTSFGTQLKIEINDSKLSLLLVPNIKEHAQSYGIGGEYKFGNGARTALIYTYGTGHNLYRSQTWSIPAEERTINDLKLKQKSHIFMLNGYYDFNIVPEFTPYIGAGLGYGAHTYELTVPDNASSTGKYKTGKQKKSKNSFTYSLHMGINHSISNLASIGIGVQFSDLGQKQLDQKNAFSIAAEGDRDAKEKKVEVKKGYACALMMKLALKF